MKAKRTLWFPPHIKPVRVGMYECKICQCLHYWDGHGWCGGPNAVLYFFGQNIEWRGLASNPRKAR